MSSLIFELMWRDRGVASGMKSLGTAADQAGKKVTDLSAKVDQAGARLTRFSAMTGKLGKGFDWVDKNSTSINTLSNGLLKVGTVAAVGVGIAVKKFADFDKAMSNVASTGDDARASIDVLRKEAIKYGADTAFSAIEAADAQAELIKANVSVTDTINGGLKGALDLAAAGSLGVADAAGIMGTALSQFKLEGTQASHVADLLAAGAGKAQGEVADFAAALKYVGPNAQAAGVSIEETVGVLAEFANQGILGSQAGTALRSILVSLTAPAGAGAKAMKDYGINVRDANGDFIGFAAVAGELRAKLGGLGKAERDAALARIFGKESLTAAVTLYEGGADAVNKWTAAVDDSGYAAKTAATKMDNLAGDIENFKGALDSAFIGAGSGGNNFLRGLTQGATDLVNAFNDLPSGAQQAALKVGAFVAVAALAAGGLGKLVVAAAETRTALMTLGITATGVKAKLAALNGAGLLAVAGFVAVQAASAALDGQLDKNSAGIDGYKKSLETLGQSGAQLDSQMDSFGSSFALLGQGINDTQSAFAALKDTQNFVSQGFRKIGDAMGMSSTAGILADEFDKIDKSLTQMDPNKAAVAFGKLSAQARAAGFSTEEISGIFDDYTAAQKAQTDAANQSGPANKNAAQGVQQAADAAREQAEAMQAATDAMYDQANAAVALSGSQIGMESAIDAANKAAKDNGRTLDVNTQKGRDNRQALNSLASATLSYTESLVKSGASAGKVVAANERGRASFIASARAMGASKKEATELANSLFTIPDSVRSQIVVAGGKISKQEAKDLNRELKDIPPEQRAKIVTIANTKGAKAARQAMAEVKDKQVIAKSKGDLKGAQAVNSAMKALKDRLILAKSRGDTAGARKLQAAINALRGKTVDGKVRPQGVGSTQRSINSIHGKGVTVSVGSRGVGAVQGSINGIRGRTVWVTVKKRGGGVTVDAAGGTMGRQFLADGGTVRGVGGPRQDNIATIDRDSGVQVAWTSVGEELINARQASLHRRQLKQINAGGKWDLVPRLAGGGSMGDLLTRPRTYVSASGAMGLPKPVVFNLKVDTLIGSEAEVKRMLEKMAGRGDLRRVAELAGMR